MRELHLFAGIGGGILGGILGGNVCVGAVELDPHCRQVLLQRQRDEALPWFPVWDDVRTFDGTSWCGRVDIVAGGFPCTDISSAGNRAGLGGEHSGLWREMARIIRQVGPHFVFVENTVDLPVRGLDGVLGDLAALGFDAEWGCFSADQIGAPHRRKRTWIVAHIAGCRCEATRQAPREESVPVGPSWWAVEPEVVRVVRGYPRGMGERIALGNIQLPAVAHLAFEKLTGRLMKVV